MRTIVISDLHNRIRWVDPFLEKFKKEHGYDEVVFLGDYFDSLSRIGNSKKWKADTHRDAAITATWLRQSIRYPDRIHLLGNHDMPYMNPKNRSLWCPGYTGEKSKAINSIMKYEDWSKLRPAHFSQRWLFTHAGASEWLFSHPIKGINAEAIVQQCEEALRVVRHQDVMRYEFTAGSRLGNIMQVTGGITWQDFTVEFAPVAGLNQIVGHSIFNVPQIVNEENSKNIALDTCNHHILIIENGEAIISDEHNYLL